MWLLHKSTMQQFLLNIAFRSKPAALVDAFQMCFLPPSENTGQLLAHCTPELGKDFYFQLKWQSQGQGDALLTLLPDAK